MSYNNTLCDFYVALKMRIKKKEENKEKDRAARIDEEEEEEDEDEESKEETNGRITELRTSRYIFSKNLTELKNRKRNARLKIAELLGDIAHKSPGCFLIILKMTYVSFKRNEEENIIKIYVALKEVEKKIV